MIENKITQEEIINHLKSYGFVFQGSEIYGGLANSWDMGPLGALLKYKLKNLWVKHFVTTQENITIIDSNIILNPLVWKASGHLENFADPLADCKKCKERFRIDKLIENKLDIKVNESTPLSKLEEILETNFLKCPKCGAFDWTKIRKFNLMFETKVGVLETEKNTLYLRPETAQGIFINFKNVQRVTRMKLPFGIAQIGKAFRNEITPGNFIFRTREFEQMEIEFFTKERDEEKNFKILEEMIENFLFNVLGIKKESIDKVDYDKNELAHYSKRTIDFFYNFPHGKSELWGLANRGKFDLARHAEFSKKNLEYQDDVTNEKCIPSVIEPSVGVERLIYAILCDAYKKDIVNEEERVFLKLDKKLAPYLIAILPLNNKLTKDAKKVYDKLIAQNISCTFDSSGSIGKRYRRQDAIGTPFCLTFDFDSLEDFKFTLRNRDSTAQEERMDLESIINFINKD